jgi:signal transduction histidine kinase
VTEIEITEIPALQPNERCLLDLHSLLNLLNVLSGELVLIGLALENNPDGLAPLLARCRRLVQSLRDPVESLRAAEKAEEHEREIMEGVRAHLARHPGAADHPEVRESLANLESVFAVLRVRARELLARAGNPGLWVEVPVADLRADFYAVFAAIERNSHGRFRVLYNAALQGPSDYYLDLRIDVPGGERVHMPPVFKDVMRDLTANARKYTPPGGRITAALHDDGRMLRFVALDTGRGIPAAELPRVVNYGVRASNVADVRTMGGGFGLTKAFFVTKQFGGRFWIASELGRGTRVRIELPVPPVQAP